MKKIIAIITGASSGFGVEFIKQIDKNFELDEIWLFARRKDRLLNASQLIQRSTGRIFQCDLRKREEIENINKVLINEKPVIKVLINNAGFGRTEIFAGSDENYNSDMIDVNIKAPVLITRMSLSYMNKGSYIANVASLAAYSPLPYFALYSSTKAFLLNFSYALNEELKGREISVTAVCPGPASTEFFKDESLKKVNGLKIEDPAKIVKKAVRDIIKRKPVSIYGLKLNLLRYLSKILPRKVLAYFSSKVKSSA